MCTNGLILTIYGLFLNTTRRHLERAPVKRCHVVLAPALIVVADDVLSDVVLRASFLDRLIPPTVVHNQSQDNHWNMVNTLR